MNKKTINLRGLQAKLSAKELKNVLGGSGDGAVNLCDPKYERKTCKKQSDCEGSGQMCITSGTSQKCCF